MSFVYDGRSSNADHESRIARQEVHTSGHVNVKSYGATGDGTTDDSAAFAAAKAAGKRIKVPDGTYSLTGITVGPDEVWEGNGRTSILKFNTTGTAVTINSGGLAYSRVPVFRGFSFQHGASTPANYVQITGDSDGVVLKDLHFIQTSAGVGIRNTRGYGLRTDGVTFNFFTGTAIHLEQSAFDATYSLAVNLGGVDISNNTGAGIVIEGGQVNIDSAVVESSTGGGITIATGFTAWPITITNLSTEGNTGWDLKLDSDGGAGTRWAHVVMTGGHLVNSPGIQINKRGYLHLIGVTALGGTVNVSQLDATWYGLGGGAGVWIHGGNAITADATLAATTFGERGVLTTPTFTSSCAQDTAGVVLPTKGRLVFDGAAATAYANYDNVSTIGFSKRIMSLATIASNTGFFAAESGSAVEATLRGDATNGSSAIGVKLYNRNALSTAGAKIVGFMANDGTTVKAYVEKDGGIKGQRFIAPVSADRGDANQTLTVGTDEQVQRWATALTANRTVTLSTTGAVSGDSFRVVRTGLGSFTLDVGGLKTIPSATAAFVDVAYTGAAWALVGYGLL